MRGLELIECPRDAMQGIKSWIPTEAKVSYLQSLLKVGFDCLDLGSFVSPKAIPQMRDTLEVLARLDRSESATDFLTIVANERGIVEACANEAVDVLGYPFSISENFQMRNTNKTIEDSYRMIDLLVKNTSQNEKMAVIYLSMGFGNPYGDPWSVELVASWIERLQNKGVTTISLSDTVGMATSERIASLFAHLIPAFPSLNLGAHLHCRPEHAIEKIDAAYKNGCRRFDTAILGYGGCPMAKDELVGNLPSEKMISYLNTQKISHTLNPLHFEVAYNTCKAVFPI